MRITVIFILLLSSNIFSQEIEYQLYVKNTCTDSIEKSIFYSLKKDSFEYEVKNLDNPFIKLPESGVYKLISEETQEIYEVEITNENSKDTLLLPSIYQLVKSKSFKKVEGENGIGELNRKESRFRYESCNESLNGIRKEHYSNGKIRISGTFQNGYAVGAIKEYYQNGGIKEILVYDNDGYLLKISKFDSDGNRTEK